MNNKLYTIGKAAEYCSLGKETLRRHIKSGDLTASRTPGGHYRVLKKDLEAFVREKGMYPLTNNRSQSRKILIVDDDPRIQAMLTKILSDQKYETETASSGFEAGAKVVKFKPGLIILDLIMPEMDGFEVCRQIKENPDTFHIKILAITGYDTEENREKIMEAGADDYMAKPMMIDSLLRHVENLMNKDQFVSNKH
ncbi:hypothetical protein LCGC14_2160430 [marine sediment metagenome]|uniref:Response regulatory domain-containing protein n=1 Tax=marine sediment metagenome TaxID=412755 RepID=A0A0F9G5R5_9ZZZZ